MKINMTKKEYLTLLDILEIAGWVLDAHRTEEAPETKKYREFEQKIFSYAKQMGFENLVTYDGYLKQYFTTREFEECSPCMGFIEQFENDTFWDELIERLVERDLIRQEGEEKLSSMTVEERFQKAEPLERMYSAEFEANGLDNIMIHT